MTHLFFLLIQITIRAKLKIFIKKNIKIRSGTNLHTIIVLTTRLWKAPRYFLFMPILNMQVMPFVTK